MRSRTENLTRPFFARPAEVVAPELLGCELIVDPGTSSEVVARIVEVEAYLGVNDPASHAYRGPTKRSAIMFGPAGHLYVYLSYGMHHCVNIVTNDNGVAGAVLLRAAEVVLGIETVIQRRHSNAKTATLLSGPGNFGQGLGLTLADNGLDLCDERSRVICRQGNTQLKVSQTPRVGISSAVDEPLRFILSGHPSLSAVRSRRVCVD